MQNRTEYIKNLSQLNEKLKREIDFLKKVNFLKQLSFFAVHQKGDMLEALSNINALLTAYIAFDLTGKDAERAKTKIDDACANYFKLHPYKNIPLILESELRKTKSICLDIRGQLASRSLRLISKDDNEFEALIPRAKL